MIKQKQCQVHRFVQFFVFPFQTIVYCRLDTSHKILLKLLLLVDKMCRLDKNGCQMGKTISLGVLSNFDWKNGVVELKKACHMRLEFYQHVLVTNVE